jgi:uncharacterized membrane protein YraQ (UPF0718 family)
MAFFDALWNFLLASSPYLLLGLFFAGLIHSFLSKETVSRLLGGNTIKEVVLASMVGVPLPLCSCSVIPTAVELRKSGASNASTASFLISTPESGVDSIMVTYALMDFPMTIIRPVSAFLTAFVAGVMHLIFNRDFKPEVASEQKKACCAGKAKIKPKVGKRLLEGMVYAYGKLINDISLWLAIGIIGGALVSHLLPNDFFTNVDHLQSRLLILLIGVPVYICASATTPLAAALVLKGLSPGAALLLLLVGPATNISNIAVLQKYIGRKGVLINIAAIMSVGLFLSYFVDWLYQDFLHVNFQQSMKLNTHHHDDANWLGIASSLALIVLLLKGIFIEEVRPRLAKKGACQHDH